MLTPRQRWQHFFLRLNEIEARANDPERVIMKLDERGRWIETPLPRLREASAPAPAQDPLPPEIPLGTLGREDDGNAGPLRSGSWVLLW